MHLLNRQQIKDKITLKTGINLLTLISMLFLAVFTLETRYARSEDVAQKFELVEKSLNKIYRQQLRQERREILKTPEEKRNPSEIWRLDDIESELRELGEIIVPSRELKTKGEGNPNPAQ